MSETQSRTIEVRASLGSRLCPNTRIHRLLAHGSDAPRGINKRWTPSCMVLVYRHSKGTSERHIEIKVPVRNSTVILDSLLIPF